MEHRHFHVQVVVHNHRNRRVTCLQVVERLPRVTGMALFQCHPGWWHAAVVEWWGSWARIHLVLRHPLDPLL